MRFSPVFASLVFLLAAASAVEFKIKVVDPQSAAVAGARVELLRKDTTIPVAFQTTSAEGIAVFRDLASASYSVLVLAPGFAAQSTDLSSPLGAMTTLQLRLAPVSETVVVSATRIPLPETAAGISVAVLTQENLTNLQPTSEADALRFLPGATVGTTGRRGSQSSLFVRGGNSDYNKVLIDGVPVNDPGGFFDFGVVPLQEADRLEFVRGAESTLYGSDAMTGVVQVWTAAGRTRVPELRFGADGGNFSTAHGFLAFSGARDRLDYNLFGDQFNSAGQGLNDEYWNASQGGNVGVRLSQKTFLRLEARHSNNRTGVQSNWNFNGQPLLPPDSDGFAHQNNFLASANLTLNASTRWEHHFSGFEYHHKRSNIDTVPDRGCNSFNFLDCPSIVFGKVNRAGFEYQGEYVPRTWARTIFGYRFEDENGHTGEILSGSDTHGLRRNHAVYGQQVLTFSRFSVIPGLRLEHNESFGGKVVPRLAATLLAIRGHDLFSGTRLRFAYGDGIKAPSFEESFGIAAFLILPNPRLEAEETRSLEAGIQQSMFRDKVSFSGTYFNNLFTNQIACCQTVSSGTVQFFNINRSLAHGAELEIHVSPRTRLRVDASYAYTSTQILRAPLASSPLFSEGAPLLRRPKHSGTLLVSYFTGRWGAGLAGTFVGRRPDSDFTFGVVPPVNHAAGYARLDPGAWYAVNRTVTVYVNVENALNKHYQEVVGYPALAVNFRAGMRFRIGGD
jgi:vitamin B12 transporter